MSERVALEDEVALEMATGDEETRLVLADYWEEMGGSMYPVLSGRLRGRGRVVLERDLNQDADSTERRVFWATPGGGRIYIGVARP